MELLSISMVNRTFKWPFQGFDFLAKLPTSNGYFSLLECNNEMGIFACVSLRCGLQNCPSEF
jgi:hypothetical protein